MLIKFQATYNENNQKMTKLKKVIVKKCVICFDELFETNKFVGEILKTRR